MTDRVNDEAAGQSRPAASLHPVVLLQVGVGAGLGACARFGVESWTGTGWPALWTVNLAGAALLGLLVGWLAHRNAPNWVLPTLGPGFLGGFTTFSAAALLAQGGTGDLLVLIAMTLACALVALVAWAFGDLLGTDRTAGARGRGRGRR